MALHIYSKVGIKLINRDFYFSNLIGETWQLSFEIQDLADVLRIFVLIELGEEAYSKDRLKRRIERLCKGRLNIEMSDLEDVLKEMAAEGLIDNEGKYVQLTNKGARISDEWRNLLLGEEPIFEVVAGVADGSVTGLVVILSSLIAGLTERMTLIAALLSLATVAITNFSSFLLGGSTEDIADTVTLQNLIAYSLSDIPDKKERAKSLMLTKEIFNFLRGKRSRANILSALMCGLTTFISGVTPILTYLLLTTPLNLILPFTIIGGVTGLFLVHYRSRKTRINWKITLLQTVVIMTVAVLASLLLGRNI